MTLKEFPFHIHLERFTEFSGTLQALLWI